MAIFKRSRGANPVTTPAQTEEPAAEQVAVGADPREDAPAAATGETAAVSESAPGGETQAEAAASVGISMSSFGGFGVASPAPAAASEEPARRMSKMGPELPPETTETVPGLRDNVLVRDGVAALPAEPSSLDFASLARQLLQGHLFLRAQGDARALLSAGKDVPLAIVTRGDDQFVLVYSSGAALNESVKSDGSTDTSAMGQPVLAILKYVLAGPYAGILLDPSSKPGRVLYPRDLLERMVAEADPQLEIKTLLAGERTPETAARVGEALSRLRVWVAVNDAPGGGKGVAEARSLEGERLLEVYSHPLEVVAMGRADQPAPLAPEQLAAALRADENIAGVIVDAAGPWIRLTREQLAPVLAMK